MILVLAQLKGGVGKTTTSITLAAEASARGYRVALVDADEQAASLTWGQHAQLTKVGAPLCVRMGSALHQAGQLPELARQYELVVVDLPPNVGEITRAALMLADVVLLPSGGGMLDVNAFARTVALVEQARISRPSLLAFALVTRARAGVTYSRRAPEVLAQAGLPVLSTVMHLRGAVEESIAAGLGPTTYAPKSPAADEGRRLFDEILARAMAAAPQPQAPKKGTSRRVAS